MSLWIHRKMNIAMNARWWACRKPRHASAQDHPVNILSAWLFMFFSSYLCYVSSFDSFVFECPLRRWAVGGRVVESFWHSEKKNLFLSNTIKQFRENKSNSNKYVTVVHASKGIYGILVDMWAITRVNINFHEKGERIMLLVNNIFRKIKLVSGGR